MDSSLSYDELVILVKSQIKQIVELEKSNGMYKALCEIYEQKLRDVEKEASNG